MFEGFGQKSSYGKMQDESVMQGLGLWQVCEEMAKGVLLAAGNVGNKF